jgi:hypothetical protein
LPRGGMDVRPSSEEQVGHRKWNRLWWQRVHARAFLLVAASSARTHPATAFASSLLPPAPRACCAEHRKSG